MFVQLADELVGASGSGTELTLSHPGGEEVIDLGTASSFGNARQVSIDNIDTGLGDWTLGVSSVAGEFAGESNRLNPSVIRDIIVDVHYRVE